MSDRLAEMYVEITAKTDKLQAGLASVKSDTAQMSAGFSNATKAMTAAAVIAGAVIVTELVGAIVKVTVAAADMADAILDVSMITGISTKQIQKYKLAADMEGKSFESITTMVKFYSAALNKAEIAQGKTQDAQEKVHDAYKKAGNVFKDGFLVQEKIVAETNEQAKAFQTLNIDLEEFNRLTTGEQLDVLLPKLMAWENINERMVMGQALLGKGFLTNMDIINTYVSKGGEISKLVDAFAPTQGQLEKAAQLKEAMGTLQFIADSLTIIMAGPLAEAFKKLEPVILNLATHMKDWLADPANIEGIERIITKLLELGDMILKVTGFLNNLSKWTAEHQIPVMLGLEKPKYAYASGGIAKTPQMAMVGEAGPEAIIPLSQMGGMGGTNVTIQAGAFMGSESDARRFAQIIIGYIRENNRLTTTGRLA